MLTIRDDQMRTFEENARLQFEDEMMAHSKAFTPRLAALLGDQQLRTVVRSAIQRAANHRFTNRGPVRLFIELTFLWGCAFDSDPQYPAAAAILSTEDDQSHRAEELHAAFMAYLEQVSGKGALNVRRALAGLSQFAREPWNVEQDELASTLLYEMDRMFPQKTRYVGEANLTALIERGLAESRRFGFETTRHQGLLVVLMFAFGAGCTVDPQYPWISRTLHDERIVDSSARAARLERKALTWLDHVLAPTHSDPAHE